ncbi:MAG: hypothetical protein KAH56_08115 [Candidatus Krumholzibacteria bacterium]|nr:hypothetical protein [Candidatus Krumholzibacteria bacterium]
MSGYLKFPLLIVLALILSIQSAAQENIDPESTPDQTPDGPGDDLEEVEEAIRVLSEAGVPPTREELARFLAEADKSEPQGRRGGLRIPIHGSAKIRVGHFQYEGLDHYGKLTLETRWLRLRARVREYRSGQRETTGTIEAGAGPIELRVGELGMIQGHGLLIGAPGRGSSLTADTGFSPRVERLVTWLGTADPRALSGFGGSVRLGNWSLRAMNGGPRNAIDSSVENKSVVQLGCHQKDWRISVTGFSGNQESGASLAGGMRNKPIYGSFETMVWQAAPGIPATGAAVLQVGWKPAGGSGIEGLFGYSDLAEKPGLASRPAVLPGWDGRGLALRGYTRTSSGTVLRGMVHLGSNLDRVGSRSRKVKTLIDLQAGRKLSRQIELAVRYRSTDLRAWQWSERYPWQPPRAAGSQRRTIISVQVVLEQARLRARLMVRSYGLDKEVDNGRRSLVSLTGKYVLGETWKLRGAWVTAWGDPVDLVSAISPLTGMVLPRHWGRWRSETVMGLEWLYGGVRVQVAGSLRNPEPGGGEIIVRTVWVEAGFRW